MITTRLIGKDTLRYCFVLIAVCVAFLSLCIRTASAEVIISFNSDITVEDNGDIVVTETIAYDFQGASKHGIIRNIKSKHAERAGVWYKEKYVDFEVVSVRKDGKSEPYTIEAYDGLLLKIGNPNLTSTGSHIYQIMYQAKGALASSEAGVELYWNVTGNEWPVNIEKTSATVRRVGSGSLLEAQSCYSGFTGTNTACPDKKVIANVATFNGGAIKPGSEFTVAQALTLSVPPQSLERVNWGLIKLVGVTAWFILLTFLVVRWRFKYRFTESIIAQYEPLPDFKPMFTGVLIDNRVDSRDISAGIIYLAQQGFIAIKQIDTESISLFKKPDYEITLRRPINEAPSDLDRSLLELFFASSDQTRGTGQVHSAVLLSSVKRKKAEGTVTRVNVLKDRLKHELVGLGLLEQGFKKILVTVCFSIIAIWMYFMSDPSVSELTSFYTLLISIILISVFATERRTREGYAALHYLKGFKLFLTVTEEDRYKLLNAPALSPQQFMEYLPYAVAFGVEKEWANVFKDMQIDDPTWYSSRSPARLDAPLLTSSLVTFSSNFAANLRSGAGSSGRGFSGGGSGGGGGRSW